MGLGPKLKGIRGPWQGRQWGRGRLGKVRDAMTRPSAVGREVRPRDDYKADGAMEGLGVVLKGVGMIYGKVPRSSPTYLHSTHC